ncbi:MAG: hypothetical protein QOI50_6696, partial [Pseudonocardiales bacterium]|nr:hypothetical protein [Pseudonocardiales bacterium]
MPPPGIGHYNAAKAGVVALAKTLAQEVGPEFIRVNCIGPGNVDTPMIDNDAIRQLFVPQVQNPSKADATQLMKLMNGLPIPWVESVDISNAVLWLASDEARYVTGITLPVDAGSTAPFKIPNL